MERPRDCRRKEGGGCVNFPLTNSADITYNQASEAILGADNKRKTIRAALLPVRIMIDKDEISVDTIIKGNKEHNGNGT
jgi:hypothetical protein